MTPTEAVRLIAFVTQISPAQKFDEFTADAWHTLLEDVPFGDSLEAVKRIGRRQPFVAPADVIAEVKVIRRERLDRADASFVYCGDPDDTVEYQRQLQAHRRAIGDGAEPIMPALERGRPTDRELQIVFRRVPRALEAVPDKPTGGAA